MSVKLDGHESKHLQFFYKNCGKKGTLKKDGKSYAVSQFNVAAARDYNDMLNDTVALVRQRILEGADESKSKTWLVKFSEPVGWSNHRPSYTISLKGSDELGWHIHPVDDLLYDKKG